MALRRFEAYHDDWLSMTDSKRSNEVDEGGRKATRTLVRSTVEQSRITTLNLFLNNQPICTEV